MGVKGVIWESWIWAWNWESEILKIGNLESVILKLGILNLRFEKKSSWESCCFEFQNQESVSPLPPLVYGLILGGKGTDNEMGLLVFQWRLKNVVLAHQFSLMRQLQGMGYIWLRGQDWWAVTITQNAPGAHPVCGSWAVNWWARVFKVLMAPASSGWAWLSHQRGSWVWAAECGRKGWCLYVCPSHLSADTSSAVYVVPFFGTTGCHCGPSVIIVHILFSIYFNCAAN